MCSSPLLLPPASSPATSRRNTGTLTDSTGQNAVECRCNCVKKKKKEKERTTTGTTVCPHSEGSGDATANSPSLQLMGDGSARYFVVLVVFARACGRGKGGGRARGREGGFSERERASETLRVCLLFFCVPETKGERALRRRERGGREVPPSSWADSSLGRPGGHRCRWAMECGGSRSVRVEC